MPTPTRDWTQLAGMAWDQLVSLAERGGDGRGTISYKDLGSKLGLHHRAVKFALDPIHRYCKDLRLYPLTVLVGDARHGNPGHGFDAWDAEDLDHARELVWAFPWRSQPNPFAGFRPGETEESLGQQLASHPEQAEEIYHRVRARGMAQRVFREALLVAYGRRCAFCGVSFENLLQAAHLKPWGLCSAAERMDPANGLLLCANHHLLFDRGLVTVTTDLRIHCATRTLRHGRRSEANFGVGASLHGRLITMPKTAAQRPDVGHLKVHHALHEASLGTADPPLTIDC